MSDGIVISLTSLVYHNINPGVKPDVAEDPDDPDVADVPDVPLVP